MSKPINLSENIEKLHAIASWFDEQTQVDVEEGLKKVKEAARLIKESKSRLKEIENEFTEIQADISEDDMDETNIIKSTETIITITEDGDEEKPEIPF